MDRTNFTKITEPGVYADFDEPSYFADPCPEPSASRSIVKDLIEKTPRHAWQGHPALNAAYGDDDDGSDDKFALGSAVHAALLSRGSKVSIYPDASRAAWNTNDAKAFKADAKANGLLPLLQVQADRVNDILGAVNEQLPEHGLERLFKPTLGKAEVMLAWRDQFGGWSRCLVDWIEKDLQCWDAKVTDVEFNEEAIGRHCASMGYEWQHAFYERGIIHLFPEMLDRVKFNFLFIEAKAPHAIMPITLPADALMKGRMLVDQALFRWAELRKDPDPKNWPRFQRAGVRSIEYPPWSTAEFI